jgi:RNA polymerase sigma-70 factor (ECF subfamily)
MESLTLQAQAGDDVALVRRMASGDTSALQLFYDRHSPGIYALCQRILHDSHEAEDVLVDVFHEYWRRVGGFDTSRGSPIGLLVTLARSRAIDRKRSLGRRRAVTLDEPATAAQASMIEGSARPDQQFALAQQRQQVRTALRSLDNNYRQAIECAYYDGMSHNEIAEALNKPLGTVKTYIRQGLLRLRDSLSKLEESGAKNQ